MTLDQEVHYTSKPIDILSFTITYCLLLVLSNSCDQSKFIAVNPSTIMWLTGTVRLISNCSASLKVNHYYCNDTYSYRDCTVTTLTVTEIAASCRLYSSGSFVVVRGPTPK